jgi:hypothetical protein
MRRNKRAIKPTKPKLLHQSSIPGQQGIDLIEGVCLAVGYVLAD